MNGRRPGARAWSRTRLLPSLRVAGAVVGALGAYGAVAVASPDGAIAGAVAAPLVDAFGWLAVPWCATAGAGGAVLATGPVAWHRPVVSRLGGLALMLVGLAAATATPDRAPATERFLDAASGSGATGEAVRDALHAALGSTAAAAIAAVAATVGAVVLAGVPRPWWYRLGHAIADGGAWAATRGARLAARWGARALRAGARTLTGTARASWRLLAASAAATALGAARLWRVLASPRTPPGPIDDRATGSQRPVDRPVASARVRVRGTARGVDTEAVARSIRVAPGEAGSGAAAASAARPRADGQVDWQMPPLALLSERAAQELGDAEVAEKAATIERTLGSFNIPVTVREARVGPTVTQFSLVPGEGVPVKAIKRFEYDLQLRLAAKTLRIELPVPGRPFVGIEIPNDRAAAVGLREILESREFTEHKGRLRVGLGRDVDGRPRVGDLARMPHVLIAGQTGAGKSVTLNTIVASLLCQCHPDELNVLMIDPKQVELAEYEGIPHLRYPVVTDLAEAGKLLLWVCDEMERRYTLLSKAGFRHLDAYNRSLEAPDPAPDPPVGRGNPGDPVAKPLPYLVLVIDELADLMMFAPDDVEPAICRLTAKARAVGIHLVVATQRPSVNVVTGLIKANIPSRIAFAVASQTDSRVILDTGGAESLLGRGDMLYLPYDQGRPVRVQGAWVSDEELRAIVTHWKAQGAPNYVSKDEIEALALRDEEAAADKDHQRNALVGRALEAMRSTNGVSISYLQRKLGIGYPKAAKLMDDLEDLGHVELDETTGRTYRVIDRGGANDDVEDLEVPLAIGRRGRGGRR